ncbi:heme-binding protein [Stutzerimonas stutzeri]|uniref:heme-binding protein n=1 Tax=Stutzerimonas stutzeri TaxID=316 RepID=UPI001C2EDD18|nr:heme-binding protein [Stutzerimonas stutzeri]
MGRGLLSGLWDVEAAIYAGPPPLEDRFQLGLQRAETALRAARAEAERHGWAVSIAVVDTAGEPLGLVKLDGSPPDSARCAIRKAQQVAAQQVARVGETSPRFGAGHLRYGLDAIALYVEERCIGAVAVHGVHRSEAAQVAQAGAEAVERTG